MRSSAPSCSMTAPRMALVSGSWMRCLAGDSSHTVMFSAWLSTPPCTVAYMKPSKHTSWAVTASTASESPSSGYSGHTHS